MAVNKSPFDFDVDFEKVARRRDQALARKAAERGETLLTGMDREDLPEEVSQEKAEESTRQYGRRGWGWFGGKGGQEGGGLIGDNKHSNALYGGKRVTQWPYDDYHVVQQAYHVKVAQLEAAQGESKDDMNKTAATQNLQRPPDPPIISKAVQDLSLQNFEAKAEERAIAIVSTWLFDSGLIDELLENGGMSTAAVQASTSNNDVASVRSQEGVEVGIMGGLPIEGPSKMDKEMNKLKSSQQRTLTLINARLNDGVAASGGEVQELVNAVNSTKDELGRLRELSTYISNTEEVEQAKKFMLTKYPKLKKAINARRNLARCFRELDFYSKIPITCDELRELLHSSEWTDDEWYSLREVSKRHVELEIFLVEAELGMKKRIDEETNGDGAGGRGGYTQGGLPYDHNEVDKFLHEHVKNVWELGEEIRMRIQSGIGSAFELTMNNPAGMVALVEAVEHYESANLEYKTVHGEEAGENQSLRFTNMRAFALKQIYQDFHLRGEENFNQVYEAVSSCNSMER
jgi:hypothetical protein